MYSADFEDNKRALKETTSLTKTMRNREAGRLVREAKKKAMKRPKYHKKEKR